VAQPRQDRIATAARTHAETTYAHKGFTVLAQRPQWRDTTTVSLCYLRTADGQEATEAAVTDPAHWAVLMTEDTVLVDADTGEPVDEADVDWSTEHQPDREPAQGARHANTVVETTVWQPECYCTDPQACGLARADFLTRSVPIVHEPTAVEDPETRAKAERAERRRVLALNKLGAAAQQVRRAWVRDRLLARLVDCTSASSLCARVSTGHQSLDHQVDALTAAGVDTARVYSDTLSGTSTREQRPGLGAFAGLRTRR
jgi:ParB family chromosome partitioning protein